ncbi:VirK/YbjX family protein [Alsobacter sp. SYSU M60028]|uniref:VirK/YbjX family protein n=1 Tax=Alsobacter ponti TaxID=2962936 RepID=A0ABT1L8I1_9HYPH|nr:DUF535 family protein [Alsobacter ponti]MCP8937376.1 VirK/YbjX family protein [Alsobacter ponti]
MLDLVSQVAAPMWRAYSSFRAELTPGKAWFVVSRACLRPGPTAEWIRYLETAHERRALPYPSRALLQKPLQPYLRHKLPTRERVRLLVSHYDALADLPTDIAKALWALDRPICLAMLSGREAEYGLMLGRSNRTRQEGEACLWLEDLADGVVLARLTFSIVDLDGARVIAIGGLQGQQRGEDKARIVRATRRLSGLRPKAALLAATQALTVNVGACEIHAVSRATHVLNAKSRAYQRGVHADYDGFWRERGGAPHAALGFSLPVDPLPRTKPSSAQDARKAAHLEAIVQALNRRFGHGADHADGDATFRDLAA